MSTKPITADTVNLTDWSADAMSGDAFAIAMRNAINRAKRRKERQREFNARLRDLREANDRK